MSKEKREKKRHVQSNWEIIKYSRSVKKLTHWTRKKGETKNMRVKEQHVKETSGRLRKYVSTVEAA